MGYVTPKDVDVKAMLAMLLGDNLEVKPAPGALDTSKGLYALYVDDTDAPVAACVCDPAFAAYAGGALSMLPPGGAEDAAKSGELSDVMVDNTYEVMNICSRLLMTDSTPHLRLQKLYKDMGEIPEGGRSVVTKPSKRVDFDLKVPRYGSGRLSLLLV